ncbi:MAG: hypothetical protein AMXMBFR46_13280 [Acidimicrobiia bacterium]
MSRRIRNERAQALQGQRAGIASRGLADAADVGIAFLIYLVIGALAHVLYDLFVSSRVQIPVPPGWFSGLAIFVVLVIYLALGWGSTGRTVGKQLMGLRVVRADGTSIKPRGALWRAFLCALFYPGLLVALFHRRNRSLQDLICKTAVVYDWVPESGRPGVIPARGSPPAARVAPASGEEPA